MSDPIRELLAFMIAKELHALCRCGAPATVECGVSPYPPVCDACSKLQPHARYAWEDLRHAAAIRRLLA